MSFRQSVPQSEKKNQPETVQQTGPEQETTQIDPSALRRLVSAGASAGSGAPDDNLPNRIQNLPASQRSQAILQMQRTKGNAYVQRMLSTHYPVSSPTLQRTPANIQREGGSGWAEGTKFAFPEKKWPINKGIPKVPIKFKEIKLGGEVAVSAKEKDDGNVQAGVAGGSDGNAGFYAEATQEWDKFAEGTAAEVSVESKGEAKVTTGGGEIGFTLIGVKHKHAAISIKFDLLNYDAKESEIEFANLSVPVDLVPVNKKQVAPDGTELNLEIKATITLVFEPDWVTIGKWIAEKFATRAAAGLGAAAGILAAGFAAVAPAMVQASLGGEVAERVERAIKYTNEFCDSYEALLTNRPFTVTQWGVKGANAANQVLKQANVPPEAIYEAAKKKNLRGEAFSIGWPKVKAYLLSDYREEHWFEWKVYGEKGPGYKILKRLLDEPEHLIF